MPNLNKCIFIGHVAKAPDIRFMQNGEAVANLSIGVSESWKDKNGQKQERVEWVNIVAYRKLADIIGEYVTKGMPIYIEGKMQTRKWEKDGVTRYATEIIADNMQMLGRSDKSHSVVSGQPDENNAPQAQENSHSGGFDDFDPNIPF